MPSMPSQFLPDAGYAPSPISVEVIGNPVTSTSSRSSLRSLEAGIDHAAAGVDHRTPGRGQQRHGFADLRRVALHPRRIGDVHVGLARRMIGADGELHVLRHVDHHGTGTAGGRDIERLVQHLRQILDPPHQPVVLGAGPGDADGVAFLERVVADQMRRHLPGDADQRDRIHQRVAQRRHHVGGAGARGHQHHAGQSGGARIAFGGVAGALLVPHQDVLDFALLENLVIDRQHRAAGIAEDVLDAMIGQRADDHRGAGHLVGIVALVVAHGWLRMRPVGATWSFGFWKIKKGPRGPMHTARLWDGLSHPRRCAWVRRE